MGTGIGSFEAVGVLGFEAEAPVIIGIAEDEDAGPTLMCGALDPFANQRRGNSISAPIRKYGHRSKAECAERCRNFENTTCPLNT